MSWSQSAEEAPASGNGSDCRSGDCDGGCCTNGPAHFHAASTLLPSCIVYRAEAMTNVSKDVLEPVAADTS